MRGKILLTGLSGFLGRNLYLLLRERLGKDRFVFILRESRRDWARQMGLKGVYFFTDPLEARGLYEEIFGDNDVEMVIHCAGISGERLGVSWGEYERINVAWPIMLAESFCKLSRRGKFVFISSIGIYGTAPYKPYISEGDIPKPDGKYHLSKKIAEECLLDLFADRNDAQVGLVILRPNTLYGEGDKGVLWKMFCLLKRGLLPVWGSPLTSFASVDLMAEVILSVWQKENAGRVVINVSEPSFKLVDFLKEASANVLGVSKAPMVLPLWSIKHFLKIAPPWLGNRLSLLSLDKVYDTSKLEAFLGRAVYPMEAFPKYRSYYRSCVEG